MPASDRTIKDVADILERELGLEKARDIAAQIRFVRGNNSFETTVNHLYAELSGRPKKPGGST